MSVGINIPSPPNFCSSFLFFPHYILVKLDTARIHTSNFSQSPLLSRISTQAQVHTLTSFPNSSAMSDLWLAIAEEPRRAPRRLPAKKSSAMPDVWLAIAEEGPASSSSSLSGRAAARTSRPRPWLQSPGPTSSPASKPRSTPAASTAAPVAGLAAGRQSPAAQAAPLDPFWAGRLADHARKATKDASRIPAPVGFTLAQDRKPKCPCGKEVCVSRQRCEFKAARETARSEQFAAARRERIAAHEDDIKALLNRPLGFRSRMANLEALANDLAQQRKSPPSTSPLRSLLTLSQSVFRAAFALL